MTCSNCNDGAGAPATVVFPREDKRVSVVLCEGCRVALEAAPRCTVEQPTRQTAGK
ncbi:hypothetical protein [Salinarchaeum laminariae]|mgnify:CR=1 FL=1|uniref:hypothetical protein n=1 Tax=Salinarchaeum laminariae TaxID=869888 RepID=UPI0020BDEADA|nr:hypothetical protein [Salinarchaeum laminariae]